MNRDTIGRARLLVAAGTFAPPVVHAAYEGWWTVRDHSLDFPGVAGRMGLFLVIGLYLFVRSRKKPAEWYLGAQVVPLTLMWLVLNFDVPYRDEGLYWATTVGTVVVMVLLALLPFRARRAVLADLSPAVVDSDLSISFTPAKDSSFQLEVGPDTLAAYVPSSRPGDRVYPPPVPLARITEVTTWTQAEATEHPVPGTDRTVPLPAGELIGFGVPDGRLVLAVKDTAKVKRFVEARVALARERAAVADG